jgi:hypothetical protein
MAQNHLRRIEDLERIVSMQSSTDVIIENNSIWFPNYSDRPKFSPYPIFTKVFNSDKKIQIVVGPYGSGKTTGFCNYIIKRSIEMTRCDDGIRRYKITLVRNTSIELANTTYATWSNWIEGIPEYSGTKKPLEKIYRFNDGNGIIELWTLFLALDKENDVKKLKSLETTDLFFNELSEINKALYDHAESRIGRYPAKEKFRKMWEKDHSHILYKDWFPYKARIFADTNPPEDDHWIPKKIEAEPDKDTIIYHQPPALLKNEKGKYEVNPEAENIEQQAPDYYTSMIKKGEEYVRVYAQGYYGTAIDGKRVYVNYIDDFHSVEEIEFCNTESVIIGVDYGTISPACLLTQFVDGQLRAIKEFVCEFMTIKQLFKSAVIPFLNSKLKGYTFEVIDDPANTDHGREQLNELEIYPEPASTNSIDLRISAVNDFVDSIHNEKPRIIISRTGCPKLRQGFLGKYNFKRLRIVGDEKYRDVPDKTHPYSDIHDGLQYVSLHFSNLVLNANKKVDSKIFINTEKF